MNVPGLLKSVARLHGRVSPRALSLAAIMLLAFAGAYLLNVSKATTSVANLEPESGTKTSQVQSVSDDTASGS